MITGIDQVMRLRGMLDGIGRGKVAWGMRAAAALAAGDKIRSGFSSKRGPYGEVWPARRRPARGTLMVRSGTLRDAASRGVRATANGIRISVSLVYAAAHQYGYPPRKLPRRRYLPLPERGWPGAWIDEMEHAAQRVLRAYGIPT